MPVLGVHPRFTIRICNARPLSELENELIEGERTFLYTAQRHLWLLHLNLALPCHITEPLDDLSRSTVRYSVVVRRDAELERSVRSVFFPTSLAFHVLRMEGFIRFCTCPEFVYASS